MPTISPKLARLKTRLEKCRSRLRREMATESNERRRLRLTHMAGLMSCGIDYIRAFPDGLITDPYNAMSDRNLTLIGQDLGGGPK